MQKAVLHPLCWALRRVFWASWSGRSSWWTRFIIAGDNCSVWSIPKYSFTFSWRPHLHNDECFTHCSFLLLACVRDVRWVCVQSSPWGSVWGVNLRDGWVLSSTWPPEGEAWGGYVDTSLLGAAPGTWQNAAAAPEQVLLPPLTGQRDRCVWD